MTQKEYAVIIRVKAESSAQLAAIQNQLRGVGAHFTQMNQKLDSNKDAWNRLHMGISATRIAILWMGREGVAALSNFAKAAFEVANQVQVMEISMKHFLGSTEAVTANMAMLKKEAVVSPFGLTGIMGLGSSLISSAPFFRQQANLERSIKVMEDLAISRSVISGGEFTPEESLQTLNRNMVRFFVTNDKQGQYLGQLSRMFPIVPWKQLKAESKGDPERMIGLLEQFVGKKGWTGMSKEMEMTWPAQWSNIRDLILLSMTDAMKEGRTKLIKTMKEGISAVDWKQPLSGLPTAVGAAMGDFMSWMSRAEKMSGLHGLGKLLEDLVEGLEGGLKPALQGLVSLGGAIGESDVVPSALKALASALQVLAGACSVVTPIMEILTVRWQNIIDMVNLITGAPTSDTVIGKAWGMAGADMQYLDKLVDIANTSSQNNLPIDAQARLHERRQANARNVGQVGRMTGATWLNEDWYKGVQEQDPIGTANMNRILRGMQNTMGGFMLGKRRGDESTMPAPTSTTTTIHVHGGINVKAVNPADFSKQLETELGDAGGGF